MRRLIKYGVVIASCCLAAAACSSSSSSGSGGGKGTSSTATGVLTIDNESGGNWTCDFNPFNLSDISFSLGNVYEPLVFVDTLNDAKTTPWLATNYTWSGGNKTLTFTIRNGVKFTNGDPLTAADVVYTFNLLKQNKTLDINAVWSVLSSVTQKGSDQVVMQFKAPAVTYFYYIADQIGIVDSKVWSKISDPTKYPDTNPIGTGPYEVSSKTCTPENIKYTANPNYWIKGEPKIGTVNYPAFLTNDTANTYLAAGNAQWGSQFIPDINTFLKAQPAIKWWFPPVANVSMFINLTNPLLKNLAVRQAMAYAIDRPKASQLGEYGEEPPSNQTGIVTPTFSSWLDTSQAATFGNDYAYNPKKAISILEKAGFTKGSNGIFAKNGQQLSFSIINNGGFSDWVNAVNVIAADLKAVGIQVTPQDLSQTTYEAKLFAGQFQLGYGAETGGPSPYFELRQWLYSANSAPIGTPAGSNFERYSDQATDNLITEYPTTTSPAEQQKIVDQLEKVMLTDIPVIPVTEAVDWFQYDTSKFSGWPTPTDPYAQPAAYNYPDWGQVMLHLTPSS
ncbi:MAG TPA: ABC transporter substrate-binding protein [Streptosporangiaceae bacterium]|jgi:peptide/nickel transport system substrate-binding protein|nr:ABC transporter substrate-binding protein [Streptosporangiaceae bacterium]